MRRLTAQLHGQWRFLAVVCALELLSTPLSLLGPVGIKVAVDNVIGGKPLPRFLQSILPVSFVRSSGHLLIVALVIQIAVALLIQAHWFCSYQLKIRSGEHMLLDFRGRLFSHLQKLPLTYHDSRGTADSALRVQDDACALKGITIDGILFLVSDVVKLLAMAIVTLLIDWRLGIVALSVAPLLLLQGLIYERRVGSRYKEVKELESSAFRVIHEALSTIRVVKAFVREEGEQRRFVERSKNAGDARVRLGFADGVFGLAVNLTTAAGMAMVLYVGVRNVQSGILTLGSLLLVVTYLVQLYAPLQNITYHFASLKASSASVERAIELFDGEPEAHDSSRSAQTMPSPVFGSIEFEDVTFAYGSKSPILRNFSCTIPAGSHVGLMGKTGSGKTTIINLLMQFIIPQSGRILLDGCDIQQLPLAELRKQFALVLQEPVLFSTTIAENIAYGNPHASRKEIIEAAKAAKAHDFILRLPEGYETNVGERGLLLSGGERQRISIARAFLLDAPILILDEPTSSIDVATEAEVLKATERLSAGRTCFFVSHRLNALSHCDLILKLGHGVPVQLSVPDATLKMESVLAEDSLHPEARVHLA